MPVKLPALGVPPAQYQDMNCDALNTGRMRLLAQREELNKLQLSSEADGERQAELTRLNNKLYTVAKTEFGKCCPVALGDPSAVRG
jgi:hypothetical protein